MQTPETTAASGLLAHPYIAREWTCHAATTVGQMVDGKFQPLVDCGGFGRSCTDDENLAQQIAAALNAAASNAPLVALRHRAHTGLACALFVPGWQREQQHAYWQGYAKALRDVERGAGNRLAVKDAASGAYQAPGVLQAAIGVLGDDIERLSRVEVLQRLAQAGVQRPFNDVPDPDPATNGLEDGAVTRADTDDEQVAAHVKHSPAGHAASVDLGGRAVRMPRREGGAS